MDSTQIARSFPDYVAVAVVHGATVGSFDIFPEEQRLLSERAVPSRVNELRQGRHAAHLALDQLGVGPVPILRGLGREPVWPTGVVGSITHSGDVAIAAVARAADSGGIGIDLEDRARYFPGLAAEVARPEELAVLQEMDDADRVDATLETFSAKESIYKAHYPEVRRFFGFDAARIEFTDGRLVGYFTEQVRASYPVDRPMEIGRLWVESTVLTWLVLATE